MTYTTVMKMKIALTKLVYDDRASEHKSCNPVEQERVHEQDHRIDRRGRRECDGHDRRRHRRGRVDQSTNGPDSADWHISVHRGGTSRRRVSRQSMAARKYRASE